MPNLAIKVKRDLQWLDVQSGDIFLGKSRNPDYQKTQEL